MTIDADISRKLAAKADCFEREVEEYLVDSRGLLRSALDISTMKPVPRGFFTEDMDVIRTANADMQDYAELLEYENSGMVSGAYLCAMLLKYDVTKDPAALDSAYRTFFGIEDLYDRSQTVETGFFSKPYGGKITLEISSDQYIYALTGLDRFCTFAGYAERMKATEMINGMSAFWARRHYTYDYFGRPLQWRLNRFTGFAWLNYIYSGDEGMKQELLRLASLPEVTDGMPFSEMSLEQLQNEYAAREKIPIEQKYDRMLIGGGAHTAQSGALSIDSCLRYNAPHRDLWLRQLAGLYERGKIGIQDNGLALIKGLYNPATGACEAVPAPQFATGTPNPPFGYRILDFAGHVLSGMHATMFARAAIEANEYFPEPAKVALAAKILTGIGHDELRNYIDPENHLPPEMKWHLRTYSGDAVTNWLWTYWQGRCRNLW